MTSPAPGPLPLRYSDPSPRAGPPGEPCAPESRPSTSTTSSNQNRSPASPVARRTHSRAPSRWPRAMTGGSSRFVRTIRASADVVRAGQADRPRRVLDRRADGEIGGYGDARTEASRPCGRVPPLAARGATHLVRRRLATAREAHRLRDRNAGRVHVAHDPHRDEPTGVHRKDADAKDPRIVVRLFEAYPTPTDRRLRRPAGRQYRDRRRRASFVQYVKLHLVNRLFPAAAFTCDHQYRWHENQQRDEAGSEDRTAHIHAQLVCIHLSRSSSPVHAAARTLAAQVALVVVGENRSVIGTTAACDGERADPAIVVTPHAGVPPGGLAST